MPRVKIVITNGVLVLDNKRLPITRLPDMLPIKINEAYLSKGGVLVLEGEAWVGMEDTFFTALVARTENGLPKKPPEEKRPLKSVESASGNLVVEVYQDTLVLRVKYRGKRYLVKYPRNSSLSAVFNPHLLAIRVIGSIDPEFVAFISRELQDKAIRELIRELAE